MSRRWPDMRTTRDEWTDGDAIAAGITFIAGVLALLLVMVLLSTVY